MAFQSNRSILEKADLALGDLVAGGGILLPAQARRFMRLLIKESVLLSQVTAVPMKAPKQEIPRMKFGQRILRPSQEGVALTEAERSKPDISKMELDAKGFKGEVHITDEQLEDNIEREQLRQTLLSMIAQRAAADMEEIAINGDTTSLDPTLAQMDGLLVKATSNVVDAAGSPITTDVLQDGVRILPSQYRKNRRALRFYTGSDAELAYRRLLSERFTNIGDRFLESDTPITFSGVPLRDIPMFPENLGAANNETALLLTNPKNIHLGIWRRIRMEWDRDISEGVLKVVVSMRFDVAYADEQGVAKVVNVAAA